MCDFYICRKTITKNFHLETDITIFEYLFEFTKSCTLYKKKKYVLLYN